MQQDDHRAGIKQLFDAQRFYRNRRLQALIEDAENRYGKPLSDEELSLVNAAGEADAFRSIGNTPREEMPE
ncbi:MAG: hypothetical protein IJB88_00270 [Clostridia bacterium]|nr:hypothetical protein [Clostridia bacterium]